MRTVPLEKKLATTITRRDDLTIIRLYDTAIVQFNQEQITLNSGGHKTVTTKRRINQAANRFCLPITLYQERHNWYLHIGGEAAIPFYDGITISRDRTRPHPLEYGEAAEAAAATAAEAAQYNGWTNRATWNVMLWLDNEEANYNAYRRHRRHHNRDYTPMTAHQFCMRLWRNGKTPDGDALNLANWTELAAAMNQE